MGNDREEKTEKVSKIVVPTKLQLTPEQVRLLNRERKSKGKSQEIKLESPQLRRMLWINGITLGLSAIGYCLLAIFHGDQFTTDTVIWAKFLDFVSKPLTLSVAVTGVYFALENYNLNYAKHKREVEKELMEEWRKDIDEKKNEIEKYLDEFQTVDRELKERGEYIKKNENNGFFLDQMNNHKRQLEVIQERYNRLIEKLFGMFVKMNEESSKKSWVFTDEQWLMDKLQDIGFRLEDLERKPTP